MSGAPVHPSALREWIPCSPQAQGSPPVPDTAAVLAPRVQTRELCLVELAPEKTCCPAQLRWSPYGICSSSGAAPARAELQQPASWEFRCQREDERHLFLPLKDVCPFPVASMTQSLCAQQHIPGGASAVNGFPLAEQGENTGKQPKETKAYPISSLSIILDGGLCQWPGGDAGRCNYWLLFAGL